MPQKLVGQQLVPLSFLEPLTSVRGFIKINQLKMIKIPLTHNRFALIDDEDAVKVLPYKWRVIQNRYAVGRLHGISKNPSVRLHRLVMDAPYDMDVDHIDHDGFNNQKDNLRICTTSQNLANQRPQKRVGKTSRFKGVFWASEKRKWQAQVKKDGKKIFLGRFLNENDAATAYNEAAKQIFGNFAFLNII